MIYVSNSRILDNRATCHFEYGGTASEFYFESNNLNPDTVTYGWLIVAFLLACIYKEKTIHFQPEIVVTKHVSPDIAGFRKVLSIWQGWYPHYHLPDDIEFKFDNIVQRDIKNTKTGIFFSGGVDSVYLLDKYRDDADALILLQGFDIAIGNDDFLGAVVKGTQETASLYGNEVIVLATNLFHDCQQLQKLWSYLTHGAVLGAIAHALGLKKAIIGSTFDSDNLFPWGCHPETDKLFSSEYTEMVHDENIRRTQKIENLIANPPILKNLRVCADTDNPYQLNCSRCGKCMRTMAAFDILGVRPECFNWENWQPQNISKLYVPEYRIMYFSEIRDLAVSHNRDDYVEIIDSLLKRMKRYAWIRRLELKAKRLVFRLFPSLEGRKKLMSLKPKLYKLLGFRLD